MVKVSKERDGLGEYAPPRPQVRQRRMLKEDEIARLIEGYKDGGTVYELGREFGVHRATVSVLLKRNGVALRMRGLDESLRPEIIRLREEGWSYYRLGPRFGVDPATVKHFLRKRG
jgi:IS30 family transposase